MIIIQKEPDEFLQSYWDLNKKHPEYHGHVHFDGISHAYHKIDECQTLFKNKLNSAIDEKISKISTEIEMAEEDGDSDLKNKLLQDRKKLRAFKDIDFSNCKTVEEMHALVPVDLVSMFITEV